MTNPTIAPCHCGRPSTGFGPEVCNWPLCKPSWYAGPDRAARLFGQVPARYGDLLGLGPLIGEGGAGAGGPAPQISPGGGAVIIGYGRAVDVRPFSGPGGGGDITPAASHPVGKPPRRVPIKTADKPTHASEAPRDRRGRFVPPRVVSSAQPPEPPPPPTKPAAIALPLPTPPGGWHRVKIMIRDGNGAMTQAGGCVIPHRGEVVIEPLEGEGYAPCDWGDWLERLPGLLILEMQRRDALDALPGRLAEHVAAHRLRIPSWSEMAELTPRSNDPGVESTPADAMMGAGGHHDPIGRTPHDPRSTDDLTIPPSPRDAGWHEARRREAEARDLWQRQGQPAITRYGETMRGLHPSGPDYAALMEYAHGPEPSGTRARTRRGEDRKAWRAALTLFLSGVLLIGTGAARGDIGYAAGGVAFMALGMLLAPRRLTPNLEH